MPWTIIGKPYSHSKLLSALNDALSDVSGYKETNDLKVLVGMVSTYQTVKDKLYSAAAASKNSHWIASIWSICGINPKTIALNVVRLKNSEDVLPKLIEKSKGEIDPASLVRFCASKHDATTIARLGKKVFSKRDIVRGLRSAPRPALTALKLHRYGVLGKEDLEVITEDQENVVELYYLTKAIKPSPSFYTKAFKRFAAANRPELSINVVIDNPDALTLLQKHIVVNRDIGAAWGAFKYGNGLEPGNGDIKTIGNFNRAISLKDLEKMVIEHNDVDIALDLSRKGFSDPSIFSHVIRNESVYSDLLADYDDLRDGPAAILEMEADSSSVAQRFAQPPFTKTTKPSANTLENSVLDDMSSST